MDICQVCGIKEPLRLVETIDGDFEYLCKRCQKHLGTWAMYCTKSDWWVQFPDDDSPKKEWGLK